MCAAATSILHFCCLHLGLKSPCQQAEMLILEPFHVNNMNLCSFCGRSIFLNVEERLPFSLMQAHPGLVEDSVPFQFILLNNLPNTTQFKLMEYTLYSHCIQNVLIVSSVNLWLYLFHSCTCASVEPEYLAHSHWYAKLPRALSLSILPDSGMVLGKVQFMFEW